jgi:hypothetical protein
MTALHTSAGSGQGPAGTRTRAHAPYGAGTAGPSVAGDMLLSLGMLLSTASQLRLGNLPIGPGEACLVLWLILMPSRLGPSFTPALLRMLTFWTLFLFAQSLGFLTGLFVGEQYDLRWLLHDAMAYPLLMAVGCLSVAGPDAADRLRRAAWMLTIFGAASLAFQLAVGWELLDTPMIHPWFWERFRGWSANPNQLALFCAVLGPLALHLADTATRAGGRVVAACCMILSLYVGRMTGSDTFTLAMVISGPVFVAVKLRAWLLRPGRRLTIHSEFAGVIVLGLPLMLVSLMPAAVTAVADAESVTRNLAKNGGKELRQESDLRLSLWTDAMQLGITTSFLGLGPGPHLEIPTSILAARSKTKDRLENLEHPQFSTAPNFEAHNSFLDLLTQGGVIAVLGLVWILVVSAWLAYRARLAGLAALVCGLGVFCMTGLIIRHPIFWFAIALCLVAGDATDRVVSIRNIFPFKSSNVP